MDGKNNSGLGERIKSLRKTLHMTQQAFAQEFGLTQQTICQWEKSVNDVQTGAIIGICARFNVNPEWLETGEGEMFKTTNDSDVARDLQSALCQRIFDALPPDIKETVLNLCEKELILRQYRRDQARKAMQENAKSEN